MTELFLGMIGAMLPLTGFALGALLGLYAGSKGMYPHKTVKEEQPKEEEKLTLEKQLENLMTYGGGE